jgi:4'-phosphopantetheinyl transferase
VELIFERLAGPVAPAATLLSADERARAARLRDPVHRQRFVLAHAFLRRELAARLGTPPASLAFSFGPAGKPQVNGLQFSFSRSGEMAALAVSPRRAVGVDIEQVRPIDVQLIAAHHFAAHETLALTASPDPLTCFYRMWTRKEAALKMQGLGITHCLAGVPQARVIGFVPADGYIGAVATTSD